MNVYIVIVHTAQLIFIICNTFHYYTHICIRRHIIKTVAYIDSQPARHPGGEGVGSPLTSAVTCRSAPAAPHEHANGVAKLLAYSRL